jgi:hypothetical protein
VKTGIDLGKVYSSMGAEKKNFKKKKTPRGSSRDSTVLPKTLSPSLPLCEMSAGQFN